MKNIIQFILLAFMLLLQNIVISQGQDYFDEGEKAFTSKNNDSAFDLFTKAFDAFKSEKNHEGMVKASLRLGYLYIARHDITKSNEKYEFAADLAKENGLDKYYLQAIDAISTSYFLLGQPEKAIALTKECISLGKEQNDTPFYSGKMIALGYSYFQMGRLDSSILILNQALKIKKEIEDKEGEILAINYLGLLYYSIGDYQRAQNYQIQCLDHWTMNGDSTKMVGALKHLSNIYISMKDWDLAEDYATRANQLSKRLGHTIQQAYTLSNLALINLKKKRSEEAISQYLEVVDIYRAVGNKTMLIDNLLKVGDVYLANQQFERADALFKEAIVEADKTKDMVSKVDAFIAYGNLSLNRSNPQDAIRWFQKAESISRDAGLQPNRMKVSNLLSLAYAKIDDHEKALYWNFNYMELKDSIHQKERQKTIYELQTKYQIKEIEKSNELLYSQNELKAVQLKSSRRVQIYLGFGLLAFALMAVMTYFFYRTKQRDNNLLVEKNQIINNALKDKELLLREIHHRVKNNLQVISSLLSMQSFQIDDPKAKEAVREGKNRVHSMSLLHQYLYTDTDLVSVDSATYIEKLSQSLFDSYNIDPERISLNTFIDPIKLDVDIMIPLGLILNELISNALKYAFLDGRKGSLDVTFKRVNENLELHVSDDGIGVGKEFNLSNINSMGFQIVKDFSTKLKALLEVKNQNGTMVKLRIPYST